MQASGDRTHDPNAMVGGVLDFLSSRTPDLEQNSWKETSTDVDGSSKASGRGYHHE